MKRVLAVVAHPDDIEIRVAGTLLLLRKAGWELHYLTLASGHCGSARHGAARTRALRRAESRAAADLLGAHWHAPLCDDLEILYTLPLLRRLAAGVREIRPDVLLTHPPVDYMEDHVNTCRLAVTAAFARGMRNFVTRPRRAVWEGEITLYHCTPHGLTDPLSRPMAPEFFVDTTTVHAAKLQALACHRSQIQWLRASQGLDALTAFAEAESRQLGRQSGRFRHAEGWWRHAPLGFCAGDTDPLRRALGRRVRPNPEYPTAR